MFKDEERMRKSLKKWNYDFKQSQFLENINLGLDFLQQ